MTIQPIETNGLDLNAKIKYANTLAASGLLPAQYRKQPANVLYAVEYGESLGLSPIQAIQGIHVIEGKPSASAALISALVRRSGHRLRVTGDDRSATAEVVRADDPEFTFTATWTIERAASAGLTSKDVWKRYPAAMLKARAISEVARDACPEALSGLHTSEELGAVVDAAGGYVAAPVASPPADAPIVDEASASSPETLDEATGEIIDAEIVETPDAQALYSEALTLDDEEALRTLYRRARDLGVLSNVIDVGDGEVSSLQEAIVARVQTLADARAEAEAAAKPRRSRKKAEPEVEDVPADAETLDAPAEEAQG